MQSPSTRARTAHAAGWLSLCCGDAVTQVLPQAEVVSPCLIVFSEFFASESTPLGFQPPELLASTSRGQQCQAQCGAGAAAFFCMARVVCCARHPEPCPGPSLGQSSPSAPTKKAALPSSYCGSPHPAQPVRQRAGGYLRAPPLVIPPTSSGMFRAREAVGLELWGVPAPGRLRFGGLRKEGNREAGAVELGKEDLGTGRGELGT